MSIFLISKLESASSVCPELIRAEGWVIVCGAMSLDPLGICFAII